MPGINSNMNLEEIKNIIFRLPTREFLTLADAIGKRAETIAMMKLAESGFREWQEKGEDIYDEKA
jgi:hypothetical protein